MDEYRETLNDFTIKTRSIPDVPGAMQQLGGFKVYIKSAAPIANSFITATNSTKAIKGVELSNKLNDTKGHWIMGYNNRASIYFGEYYTFENVEYPSFYLHADANELEINQNNPEEYARTGKFGLFQSSENFVKFMGAFDHRKLSKAGYIAPAGSNNTSLAVYETSFGNSFDNWEIFPVEEFEIVSINYYLDIDDYISSMPDFVEELTLENNTPLQQSMTANFTRKASETSSFSETQGVKITVDHSVRVGIAIVGGSSSISYTSSHDWSFSRSETIEDTRAYTFPLVVAPYSRYKAKAAVNMYQSSATYIITARGKSSRKTITLLGKWNGIMAGTITYTISDETGQTVKSFNKVPLEPIVLK